MIGYYIWSSYGNYLWGIVITNGNEKTRATEGGTVP